MKASIVDLRYKMSDILNALDRNEQVTILYHGKEKGTIIPKNVKKLCKVKDHPFFGMLADDNETIDKKMESLRGNRFNAL